MTGMGGTQMGKLWKYSSKQIGKIKKKTVDKDWVF